MMFVISWWNNTGVIESPTEADIRRIISSLDNQETIGVSLFYVAPYSKANHEERIVILGGDRVYVSYWPANAEEATHTLIDENESLFSEVPINFGDGMIFGYRTAETVKKKVAIEAVLNFFSTRQLTCSSACWVQITD